MRFNPSRVAVRTNRSFQDPPPFTVRSCYVHWRLEHKHSADQSLSRSSVRWPTPTTPFLFAPASCDRRPSTLVLLLVAAVPLAMGGGTRNLLPSVIAPLGKDLSSSTMTTIHTPIAPPLPSSGVQCIHLFLPSSSDFEIHRTFAVTPRPSANAAVSSSRTRLDPPILLRKGDCNSPGIRWDGLAKRMRRAGYGRMSRY